jgi:hypothetical protein
MQKPLIILLKPPLHYTFLIDSNLKLEIPPWGIAPDISETQSVSPRLAPWKGKKN